jgi:N-acetylmuramoyl-L-alanine amidase
LRDHRVWGSAHYIIDLNGDTYHAVPDNEVAYHCGSSQKDPASGRIYTDWARAKFGRFAENHDINWLFNRMCEKGFVEI